jgi:hypothetical protein
MFRHAYAMELEGIVSKKRNTAYLRPVSVFVAEMMVPTRIEPQPYR